jgi:hypothetical protein
MNLDPSRTLKWSGVACAMLWSAGMIWCIGSFDPAAIVIFSVAGVLFGLCWYLAMRFIFATLRMLPRNDEATVGEARRGKFYRWMVWAALMTLTGITTAATLDLVNPLLPAGDMHWLARSLFVIVVWPALMWSLRPFVKRHLPA